MTDITVNPSSNVTVEVSASADNSISSSNITDASGITYASLNGVLNSTNLQSALDELDERKFTGDNAPSVLLTDEGDIWYDTDDNITYVRKDSDWVKIMDEESALNGGYF